MHARGIYHLLAVTAAWFGWNAQWGALLGVVLPGQVAVIAGDDRKELVNGLVGAAGALVSLVGTPIAGALSDRSRSRFGRRRPFMLAGALVNLACLCALGGFGRGGSLVAFAAWVLALQAGANLMGGPYAALVPDVVPRAQVGLASGIQALMAATGLLTGILVAGVLARGGGYGAIYLFLAAASVASLAPTLAFVREPPPPAGPPRRASIPTPRAAPRFYRVLAARAAIGMGTFGVFPFLLYFLGDIVHAGAPNLAVKDTSLLLGVLVASGVPATIAAGAASDRIGRRPVALAAGLAMAAGAALFVADAYAPSMAYSYAIAIVFGIGNGAFDAVSWALAVDALPSAEDAARDMGIWHVAIVLPQVIAPALAGVALAGLKPVSLPLAYTCVFALSAAWFATGTYVARRL